MGYVVRMPQLGMSMEQGLIVEWRVEEGDAIAEGDVIAIVESEKTQAEVEAREDGVLGRILIEEEMVVEPGDPIGIVIGPDEDAATYLDGLDVPEPKPASALGDGTESAGDAVSPTERSDVDPAKPTGDAQATPGARRLAEKENIELSTVDGTGPQGVITDDDVKAAVDGRGGSVDEVKATPGARQLAESAGVDLTQIDGTGPQGVITDDDVESAIDAGDAGADVTQDVVETRPLSGMQRTIADRLSQSYREAVHVTLHRSFDTTHVDDVVTAARDAGAEVSLNDVLIKAVGSALEAHPAFNAVFEDGEHRLLADVNIGVAVDIDRGLVTPVIESVTAKSAEDVNDRRRALTEQVQTGEFTMDELTGGSFTISNLGMFGVDHFDPVINPPQIAILGVGRRRDDASMTLSLSFDHRVVNGADAARFLDTLVDTLTDPGTLVSFFTTDLAVEGGREEETRDIHVKSTGYTGSYSVEGLAEAVPFDEPLDMGGTGRAPTPVEHLLGALGGCLALALRAMADRDDLAVEDIESHVSGAPSHGPLEDVTVLLSVHGVVDEEALATAVTKATRACYVERSLAEDLDVTVEWEVASQP